MPQQPATGRGYRGVGTACSSATVRMKYISTQTSCSWATRTAMNTCSKAWACGAARWLHTFLVSVCSAELVTQLASPCQLTQHADC